MDIRTAAERARNDAIRALRAPVPMQQRVQFAVLLQFAEHGTANRVTTLGICPGTDRRDLETALGYLMDDGSIDGPSWRLDSLVELAEGGGLTLTTLGRRRLTGDAA